MFDCTFLIFFNDVWPLDEERDILRAILFALSVCVVGKFADAQTPGGGKKSKKGTI